MDAISRTLQVQLRQEREVLTGKINKAMSQVNARVDDIEVALGNKLGEDVDMLQELSSTQKRQGHFSFRIQEVTFRDSLSASRVDFGQSKKIPRLFFALFCLAPQTRVLLL